MIGDSVGRVVDPPTASHLSLAASLPPCLMRFIMNNLAGQLSSLLKFFLTCLSLRLLSSLLFVLVYFHDWRVLVRASGDVYFRSSLSPAMRWE